MSGGGATGHWMGRLERSTRALALLKLANVVLVTLWGFAVTFVFVRVLPLGEFRAFLILVAFGNFTISAEFGITQIAYARLRKHWLGDDKNGGDFRFEEIGVLFAALTLLIVIGTAAVASAIHAGMIRTDMPALFLLFFILSCLNVLALLLRRALAAVDRNIAWDVLEFSRRLVAVCLLASILLGLDIYLSIAIQVAMSVGAIILAMILLQRHAGMKSRHWLALRVGGGHVRRAYLRDAGTSAMLTLSEITAYNAPYFTIALATRDARAMLLFDFLFKISRALSAFVRATIEAALPRLTQAYYARDGGRFGTLLRRAVLVALGLAAAAGVALMVGGRVLVYAMFDGKLGIGPLNLLLLAAMLVALSVTCVSVYLQGALGRFSALLAQSLPFLAGSLLSVPTALLAARNGHDFTQSFACAYAATFVGTGALHAFSLRRLSRNAGIRP